MATITAVPKSSLADEPLKIHITGLKPSQLVTIQASLTDEKGVLFHARAFYFADKNGDVDLVRDAAAGGDYSGVQPMGIFLFLKPEKPFSRLMKRDVMNTPYKVQLDVFDSFQIVSPSEDQSLAKETVDRWYSSPGVQRIPVRHGRVRGALFLPAGQGPFPGVIDIFGGIGGLTEFRASLLASRGFATLALAYFAYEDLPFVLGPIDLEYFEEAAEFLLKHPKVRGPRLGIVAICKGAEIALAMATFLPQIGATVCINGTNAVNGYPLYYRDLCIQPIPYKHECMLITEQGLVDMSNIFGDPQAKLHQGSILPVEKAQGKILFIVGESDKNYNSKAYATEILERMTKLGKTHCTLLSYPGAGHLIEPPSSPCCYQSWLPILSHPVLWGGEAQAHAAAQIHSWREIQKFLYLHLVLAQSSRL
ncbi:bile acid-CoA:amino acid N-acyltransferase [Eublepharis macularius]|uniref:Bile acid-CoA:amino acid N-acyltransferase n=1 Tax=Eublepharis macularius TaxID=481883 RepID=A0AA97L549_EUBMA|nr:bile acid-CoA:amino acid N-acyltransferase [Eublepharis macularius]